MNSITNTNTKEIKASSAAKNSKKDVETTGSLAANKMEPIFTMPNGNNYDMFNNNPFSLTLPGDFASFDNSENSLASNSSFMQGFATAMDTLAEGLGSLASFGGAGGSAGTSGASGGGSCSSGGGFIG